MSFVRGLKLVYENEIEILESEYEKYSKKMLAEHFDIERIKDDLESVIVHVISDYKQRGDSQVEYAIEGMVTSVNANVMGDNILDLILPYKFIPIFSDVIGTDEFIETLESQYPFRLLKTQIEKEISGVDFEYRFKVEFRKEDDGKRVISRITWNPTLIFDW